MYALQQHHGVSIQRLCCARPMRSARTSAVVQRQSLAISPGCGVQNGVTGSASCQLSPRASAFSASASSTSGTASGRRLSANLRL